MMKQSMQVLACALGMIGCEAHHSQITIGSILSQTGSLSTVGNDHLLAVQLAVDEINSAGGIRGSALVLVNADDRSTAHGAATAASTLIARNHVPVIIGAIASDPTLAANQVTTPAQVVLISGGSTATELGGSSPYFFRTCPSDALQGQLLAKRAWAKGFKRVAIVWAPGSYGSGMSAAFTQSFMRLGGAISSNQTYTPKQTSYRDVLQQTFASPPDAILLVAYPLDGAQIVSDYNSGFAFIRTFWFFTDSTQDSSFVDGVGASNFTFMHEGTGAAMPTTAAYATFSAGFVSGVGKAPEGYSPNFYDATYLVALALAAASKSDGPSVRAALRAVADPPGLIVGPGQWAAASAALAAGTKVNYEGASGSVDLDGKGDVVAPYAIWQVRNGTITSIDPAVLP
jgi:branched-chain amino acid transport system substrate-binding protein